MVGKKGFSHILFITSISFLVLAAGVATAFGLLGRDRQVTQDVACKVEPGSALCRRSQTANAWTLAPAEVKGRDVTFFFAPSSDGNVSLRVTNSLGTPRTVFDSGLVGLGIALVTWKNAPADDYTAVLVHGGEPVSNKVSFSVSN